MTTGPQKAGSHQDVLDGLAAKGRLRALTRTAAWISPPTIIWRWPKSDALRGAAIEALARGVPLGAGGSRLLRGNHPEHEALEEEAASFFGSETALYFPTGFAANAAIAATLPRAGDLIVYDALIHASFRDGLDPARIPAIEAPHNDVAAMDAIIKGWRAARRKRAGYGSRWRRFIPWMATARLWPSWWRWRPGTMPCWCWMRPMPPACMAIRAGDLGARYEGAPNIISLHTCGKGLGAAGALVCLPRLYRDFMVNRGRAFIYSTAPSPLMAAVVRAALKICAGAEQERTQLQRLVRHAEDGMRRLGLPAPARRFSPSFWVRTAGPWRWPKPCRPAAMTSAPSVRPPCPKAPHGCGSRSTLHVTPDDLDALFADLAGAMARQ